MKKEPLSPGAKRGGKALFPRPAALPLPQPRRWLGTRAVARCWGPGRRRGASDNAGSVCAGICVLRPPGMQGLEEPLCCHHCRHKGCPSLAALPVTQLGSARLLRARGEGKLFLQQHCPARTRLLRDCPAAGRISTDFLSRRLASWLGPHLPRGCRQRGTVSPRKRWCELSPCSSRSGHRMAPEGQAAGSGHGEHGPRNIWCPVHWHLGNIWVQKA